MGFTRFLGEKKKPEKKREIFKIFAKNTNFWIFYQKIFEIFGVENFSILLILIFSKNVLKTLLRGTKVPGKNIE